MMAKILEFIRSIPASLCFSIAAYMFIAAVVITLIVFFVFETFLNSFPIYLSWLFLLLGFYQRDIEWLRNSGSNRDSLSLIEDAKTLAIVLSMAALLNVFGVFDNINSYQFNVFSLAMTLLYAGYILLCAGFALSLLIRLMNQRPHAQLKKLSRIMIGLACLAISIQLFIPIDIPTISHIIGLIFAIVGVVNTRGLSWFEGIAKRQKRDLVWSMSIISISTFIIAAEYGQISFQALKLTTYVFEPLIASIGMWLFFNSVRMTLLSLYSLPTAQLMDRKSSELSTLGQLTSNAIKSQSIDAIISDTLDLLPTSIQAQGIYCRIYALQQNHLRFDGILGTELTILTSNPLFTDWISTLDGPHIIHELPPEFNPNTILFTRSVLAMPLLQDGRLFGEIILTHVDPFHFTPEDESMVKVFAESISITSENVRLLSISKEHDRLENEMEIAKRVQKALLPQSIHSPEGYSISSFAMSAKVVGGDFYDVFELANGNTCIIIADVSGKGISAAFWMATLRGTILSLQTGTFRAKEILIEIQQILSLALEPHMFITASCVIIEHKSNTIQFARAGHMPLLHIQGDNYNEFIPRGIGIGLSRNTSFFAEHLEEQILQLSNGDMCLLYTDGLIEMFQDHRDLFHLCIHNADDPEKLIGRFSDLVITQKDNTIKDDITVIAIKNLI